MHGNTRKYTGTYGNTQEYTGAHENAQEYIGVRYFVYSRLSLCVPVFRAFPCIPVYLREYTHSQRNTQAFTGILGNARE